MDGIAVFRAREVVSVGTAVDGVVTARAVDGIVAAPAVDGVVARLRDGTVVAVFDGDGLGIVGAHYAVCFSGPKARVATTVNVV